MSQNQLNIILLLFSFFLNTNFLIKTLVNNANLFINKIIHSSVYGLFLIISLFINNKFNNFNKNLGVFIISYVINYILYKVDRAENNDNNL